MQLHDFLLEEVGVQVVPRSRGPTPSISSSFSLTTNLYWSGTLCLDVDSGWDLWNGNIHTVKEQEQRSPDIYGDITGVVDGAHVDVRQIVSFLSFRDLPTPRSVLKFPVELRGIQSAAATFYQTF